ncbi:hypothetical protein GFJ94_10815 [Flavobacterium sp. LMO8]|uniref:hypothetical protein n=1 Tax=Flavobacterium sp. LMO8 TaxID=2654244 RepID=UPI001291DD50|nr:hypothetical protein [Flavobacterium sp. LMO8]MQP25556.1 hypothetical protein [Flavobacterium sp. LMO8]
MKKLLTLAILASAFIACTDDDIRVEQNLSGPQVVGFNSSFESVAYFEDLGAIEREFPVNLLNSGNGQLTESDIVVEYEINYDLSTATEGVEFDFVNSTGSVVIPAGTNFGMIPLIVNTGSLNPTAKTELVLNLTATTEGSVIGEQYKTMKIVFVGCETNLEGTYTRGSRTADISKIAPNVYYSTYFPAFSSYYWFEFSDVCGDLAILDWQFQASNPITPTDSPDEFVHGIIESNGDLTFSGANVAGVSWYVDLTWTLVKQ